MWLYCNRLIHILVLLLAKLADSFDNAGGYSSFLERKVTLKLKTAMRLKHNFGKVLHELPAPNYELYHSVKTIQDYLKNGGSLIECLDVLPSIAYVSIQEQIDGILEAMENHLPRYLMPAISLLRRSMSDGVLDIDEIYRPVWGPPKSDPLEKIPLRELKEAASPLTYREPIKDLKGPWPKIIGEVVSLISYKIIPPRRQLIAYLLANLQIPDATAEVRDSIVHLVEHLRMDGERELTGFRMSSDPYELTANAISSLSLRNENLVAANLLLPFLKKLPVCRKASELTSFFHNNTLNYTLLVSRDRMISRLKTGAAFLSMIREDNVDIRDTVEHFFPFEHMSWKDMLLAFVSQLRRHYNHQGEALDVVDSIYGDLILKDDRKRWRLPRNRVIMATILSAMGRRENSARIQRLVADVGSDRSIEPETWRKALAFDSSEHIYGPVDAVVKTLKALLASGLLPHGILTTNIAELANTFDKTDQVSECGGKLDIYLANFTRTAKDRAETGEKMEIRDVDVEDLLQALPELDVYTDEYKNLKSFLFQSDLVEKIGYVTVNKHPTRGRLLTRLLQLMKNTDKVDDSLRHLAMQLVDKVAYEGYGAGALLRRSN